jgi:hypothetical protein
MIYREYLVMRKALLWFLGIFAALLLIGFIAGSVHTGPRDQNLSALVVASGWLAAIFASIFGVALGNGSREAARVLWVLPVARWKVALQTVAVDLAGSTVAFACVFAMILAFLTFKGMPLKVETLQTAHPADVAMALAMAYATYGWSALIGILGRRMAYAGVVALPALLIWMIMAQLHSSTFALLRVPAVLNPFAVDVAGLELASYAHHHFDLDPIATSLQWLGTTWTIPVLGAILLATCALAVTLWQRAEAIQ